MPENAPPFDVPHAHRYFAANCFNKVWTLIDKEGRTPGEDEQMLLLAQASLWHWTERADSTPQNLSVGHWLVSRVYACLGDAAKARQHGQRSLELAQKSSPFFVAYAHEALARAALIASDKAALQTHLAAAHSLAAEVVNAEDRKLLMNDLEQLAAKNVT